MSIALAATTESYVSVADELAKRIASLIQVHPEIMQLETASGLFGFPDFQYDDLRPTFFQASWALQRAQWLHNHAEEVLT